MRFAANLEMYTNAVMNLRKSVFTVAAFLAAAGWLVSADRTPALTDAGKSALSRQLSEAVSHGDTPGVAALVVLGNTIS